jgi:radical SAM protein with 4Fe4S-binding SPASM domain
MGDDFLLETLEYAHERRGQPARHILEDVLAYPVTRRILGVITRRGAGGKSLFERLCENYNRPDLSRTDRFQWRIPELVVDYALKRAKLDRDVMTEKLFHHEPTVRSLALAGRSIARYGLSAPQRFAAPLMVVWNITQACNLACRHCFQEATAKPCPDELTVAERLNVIDQLGDAGVPFLKIAGGEPLVCKDLWPVLERARERGIHVSLATNGTLLNPGGVARLLAAGVKYVEVGVDSISPQEHDEFRRHPGAWHRSIRGIRNCVAGGMRTGYATCFTRHTVATVDDAVQFAIQLGCRTFSHFDFIPVGRGEGIENEDLSPSQREWLMRRLVAHLQERKINVISTAPQFGRACAAYGHPEGIFAMGHAGSAKGSKTLVLARYVGGCGAGRSYCAIQPNGDVTPCVSMPALKAGNLRHQRIEDIWDCDLFGMLSDRSDHRNYCVICKDRSYCGGCRARALAYTDDIRAGDPGCSRNYKMWEQMSMRHGCDEGELVQRAVQCREREIRSLTVAARKGNPVASGRSGV